MDRLHIKEISKEHLKRMVDIFGREATWSFLSTKIKSEEVSINVLNKWAYADLFRYKYPKICSMLNLDGKSEDSKYTSWLSFKNQDEPVIKCVDSEGHCFETDLEFFFKEMGSVEWEDRVLEDFKIVVLS